MSCVMNCALLLLCCVLIAESAPWHSYETRQRQACGDKLADIMSLVCSGRGYNVAFRPEGSNARRFRRGIVEECCRKSCSPAMLELYCRAEPADELPMNIQIRKRSDTGTDSGEQQTMTVTKTSPEEERDTITPEHQIQTKHTTTKEGTGGYRVINLFTSTEQNYKQNTKSSLFKQTPNDTTEEHSNLPLVRHHKGHHLHRRHFRSRKASKTKRDKASVNENTFQIGTVKPYFAGRAFVSYRSLPLHHGPLS